MQKYNDTFNKLLKLSLIAVALLTTASFAQTVSTYASGVPAPIGIEIDNRGWIWVAQQGTGNDDALVSVVTAENQVHPFITGLPSETNPMGEVAGVSHVYFNTSGELLIVQGEGTDSLSQAILVVDTTGFVPGSTPLDRSAIKSVYKLGDFVLDEQGFAESNPYTLAYGPEGDLFVVDAAANAIIRRDNTTGDLNVFATFEDVANNTGIGAPFIDAVPTGIIFNDSSFFVGNLTGFPFPNNAARIYEVDTLGNVSEFQTGLTTIVDLTSDPDGNLVALQHAAFQPPPPFAANSGVVLRLSNSAIDTLVSGLNRPTSVRFASENELFVSTLIEGEILRIELMPTSVESSADNIPKTFGLQQNYPNPFNPQTTIRYELAQPGRITLRIFNLLGQEIRTLIDERQPAGSFDVVWDGANNHGQPAASGVYLYQLEVRSSAGDVRENFSQIRKMILLQ